MRKSRRIISLILALTMMFTFMAMSASAATTEVPEIQPRGTCPNCIHGYMEDAPDKLLVEAIGPWSTSCPNIGAGHYHYYHTFIRSTLCRNCGYTCEYDRYVRLYCPYNGYIG